MKTQILQYYKLFNKIFTNCIINEVNTQSIISHNCTSNQAININFQVNILRIFTFDLSKISDIFKKSNYWDCKNWAKWLFVETLSILDISKNSTYNN